VQDVVELAEQFPLQLSQAGLVIVAESLENVQHIRQLKVDNDKLKVALQWLMKNNSLYHDVIPFFHDNINVAQLVEVVDNPVFRNTEKDVEGVPDSNSRYVILSENVSILRGTFHQANDRFDISSRGNQCLAIAAIACVAFCLLDPNKW